MNAAATGTGPPDFVGMGAHDAAGRWWHRLLLRHPSVVAATPAADGGPASLESFHARAMTDADVQRYHARFERPAGTISGEWVPRYLGQPWTAPLIARAAPGARVLVMLADPIAWYEARLGPDGRSPDRMRDLVLRGRYADHLALLRRHVDRERTLVLQYERCLASPAREYARTLRFLGLPEDVAAREEPAARSRRVRTTLGAARRRLRALRLGPRPRLWPDIETALHDELDPQVRELAAMVPDLDLRLWPHFAHLAPARPRGDGAVYRCVPATPRLHADRGGSA